MRGVTPEDYRRLERVSSLTAGAAGSCAYTVYGWQDGAYRRRVEVLQAGSAPQTITAGGLCEKDPAFSADGGEVFFLSDGRLCAWSQGALRQVFTPDAGWEAFGYAVLSGGAAVKLRREKREEAPEGCDWEMPLVAENLRYRTDADHGFTRYYDYRLLWLPDGEAPVTLAEGEKDWLALTGAGEQLIFGQGGWKRMNPRTGEVVCLDEALLAMPNPPSVSPDGRWLLAAARSKADYQAGLYILPLEEGESRPVRHGYDLTLSPGAYCDASPERMNQLTFTARGEALAVMTAQARTVLAAVTLQDGAARTAETDAPVFECAAAGGKTWVIRGGSDRAMEVCLLEDGCCRAQAQHNAWLAECALAAYRTVDVPAPDGRQVLHGWYMLPEKPQGAPVLLWIHGGPEGFYTDGLYMEMQAAVAAGFAVVLPNPRGSSGYGSAYQHDGHAFDDGACMDVLTLLDEVLRRHPELDAQRLGVLGGSYGGYLSAMLAGTTKRFRAAVVIKPVTNWLFIHFKSSQSGQDVFSDHRDFQDFLTDTLRQSPIIHAGKVEIPTLIIHGEKDQTCPVDNAHQFYVAVRDTHPDLPVRLMVMPACCHAYSRDSAEDYIVIQQETLRWLLKYV